MTENELAKRAVACKGWRWMPGMLALDTGLRLDEMTDDWEAEVPDFSDPATLGCLLALVREAWGCKFLVAQEDFCHKALWCVRGRGAGMPDWLAVAGMSEAEVLVAALEAAP
jgi:hypothetical protein